MEERRSSLRRPESGGGASKRRYAAEVSDSDARDSRNPRREAKPQGRNSSPERGLKSSRNRSRSPRKQEAKKKPDDYTKLIPNYQSMTPAERVRAKMDFQLSRTAERDNGRGSTDGGWERFKFSNDAPLDEQVEKIDKSEASQADQEEASFTGLGQSFFSRASQATRQKHTEAAHDAAMFGVPVAESPAAPSPEKDTDDSLLSEQVIAMQNETWQQRARRLQAAKDARM